MEWKNINSGEKGSSVRAKLNSILTALVSGSEGVNVLNRVYKELTKNLAALSNRMNDSDATLTQKLHQVYTYVDKEVDTAKQSTSHCMGFFDTESALKSTFVTAKIGDIAYVGTLSPYTIWKWGDSGWYSTGKLQEIEVPALTDYLKSTTAQTLYQKKLTPLGRVQIENDKIFLSPIFEVVSEVPIPGDSDVIYLIKKDEGVSGYVWVGDSYEEVLNGFSSAPYKEVTYEELVSLRNTSMLNPGQSYRITDYITSVSKSKNTTMSAGHQFDIIITADTKNTLNEVARACLHEGDTYFSDAGAKLEAWRIWYCIDNDFERFDWADADNGKGVIYRMIDEWGNDCPYDFKNIMFLEDISQLQVNIGLNNVYLYTFSYILKNKSVIDTSIFGNNGRLLNDEGQIVGVFNNTIKPYLDYDGSFDEPTITAQRLNRIVFVADYQYDTDFYDGCYSNTFGNGCRNNLFGNTCTSNVFGNGCTSNFLGDGCKSNVFGNDFRRNILERNCSYCTFMDNIESLRVFYMRECLFESGCSIKCFLKGILNASDQVKYFRFTSGVKGDIEISENDLNLTYQTIVAVNSKGQIKKYCVADLID